MKLNKKTIIAIIIILLCVGIGIGIYLYMQYLNSNKYKLKKVGYQDNEITQILEIKDDKIIEKILNSNYDKNTYNIIKEKYFIFDNFDRYFSYLNSNPDTSFSDVISIVNVNRDNEFYTNSTKTDTSKDILMLVNKYNYLTEEYQPDDIESINSQYAYANNSVRKEVKEHFIEMCKDAKKEDLTLIANSTYRNYQDQEKIYNSYVSKKGQEYADKYAARPGHSEHQTGLTIDIITYNSNGENFENTDEFKWLSENAYKYGFILRYPKDKEYLTGYAYESWHYRYVGLDVAKKIKDENITYDEYYAYYLK